MELQGQGDLGAEIEATEQFSSMKAGFATGQACQRGVERPNERRAPQRPVYAGCVGAGSVQDTDGIKGGRAVRIGGLKEVLIALHHAAEREAVDCLRKKQLRLYL